MPKPSADKVLTPFPIHAWRRAVDFAAGRLGVEAIAPFGFELTGSTSYLTARLRYFFVYIERSPLLPDPAVLISRLCAALDEAVPSIAETIEIVDYDRHVARTSARTGSRNLVIRSVDAQRPLLATWARYILAAALTVNRARITAVTDFRIDLMAQRYGCQLATIHDALFSTLEGTPRLSQRERIGRHLSRLQGFGLAERYALERLDAGEVDPIADAIERYSTELNRWIESIMAASACDPVPDFHGRLRLESPRGAPFDALEQVALQRFWSYADARASAPATPLSASGGADHVS